MTLERMREIVWMAENWLSPSAANRVGVGCNRYSAGARAAMVAALPSAMVLYVEVSTMGRIVGKGKPSTILSMAVGIVIID